MTTPSKEEIKQKALDFLRSQPMAVLSTTSNNEPWGAAIYYVADDNFNFFFVTRSGTHKYKDIETNPKAALTIADEKTQVTVQVAGNLSHVPTRDIKDIVFTKLASIKPKNDKSWLTPVIKVHEGDWEVMQLTPTKLQYANFKEKKTEVFDEYINVLIPEQE